MRSWKNHEFVNLQEKFQAKIGGNRLISETLIRRGLDNYSKASSFLNPDIYSPTPAEELPDMDKAVEILNDAITRKKNILVWGDFDVDGQTATTLYVSALRQLGVSPAFHIPIRSVESHGIQLFSLKEKIQDNKIDLLLTCDTGISAHDSIQYARQHGVEVIVTDHHQLPAELPQANSIINPRFLDPSHPLSTIPGVGVSFKLVEALFKNHNRQHDVAQFLDLVALGIVADIAELRYDTRYLLQKGIQQLKKTERIGLITLMEQAELNPANMDEELIAFGLAPRLNALGRLADANSIVNFFTTGDITKARLAAIELEALNARRKLMTDQVFDGALALIDRDYDLTREPAIILSHPAWPAGIIGIVASRLVEFFQKPVILISSPPGDTARGSARSVPGINITQTIAKQSQLLENFGGHPMAAGFAIKPDLIPSFISRINAELKSSEHPKVETDHLFIDAWLSLNEITLDILHDINRLAPFGAGNPPLIFATHNLHIIKERLVGRYNEHRLVTVQDQDGRQVDTIWWQGSNFDLPTGHFSLAYNLRSSNYQGKPGIQISWVDCQLSSGNSVEIITPRSEKPDLIDFRNTAYPEKELQVYLNQPDTIIYSEGLVDSRRIPGAVGRKYMRPAEKLVIWTVPPGIDVLNDLILKVKPKEVIYFAVNPEVDEPLAFLNRLAGMLKFKLNEGSTELYLDDLASAAAHKSIVIEAGLNVFTKNGIITFEKSDEGRIKLHLLVPIGRKMTIDQDLVYLLKETAAFRNYYCRADLKHFHQVTSTEE